MENITSDFKTNPIILLLPRSTVMEMVQSSNRLNSHAVDPFFTLLVLHLSYTWTTCRHCFPYGKSNIQC